MTNQSNNTPTLKSDAVSGTAASDVEHTKPIDSLVVYEEQLREKIIFGLSVYPFISPSQLHVFLGTSTSSGVWKPILEDLITEGKVTRTEKAYTSSQGRSSVYTILHLSHLTHPDIIDQRAV